MVATKFASLIAKDFTVNSVHTTTALGNQKAKRSRKFSDLVDAISKRDLKPHDEKTAKTPFLYDVNALSSLRPDQVPRFFGALTDSDKLPEADVKLDELHAMQDRVDPDKVDAMRENGVAGGKLPVVVQHNGKKYIADGHHRLAAQWLDGAEDAKAKFLDLEPVSNALKRAGADDETKSFKIAKIDESLGLVFGWAIVCKVNGQDYYDLNIDHDGPYAGKRVPEHITEEAMTKAAADFMETARPGNELHVGPDVGTYVFAFPMTTDVAKAMGIQTEKTGLMVAYKAPPDVIAKFRDGTYTGFSIEGRRLAIEEHE